MSMARQVRARAVQARQTGLIGKLRRDRAALLRTTALQAAFLTVMALPAAAQPAPNARPTGGTVVGGGVTISQSPANTQVTQTTSRGAVDWKTFDVGSAQSVTFAQPNAAAITLNRVTTPNPSQIAGQITANGQIVIVNQSGVVFFPGSQVNAQSLVVSAAGIDPKNFMAGSLTFDQAPKPGARIVNAGTLTAGKAGLIGLVAPSVANSGVINAKMGHVVLAGAEAHTLDMYGDGLISLDVTKQVTTLPLGPDGKPVTALVTNTGIIRADGGSVQLTAVAADGLIQTLVNAGGTISAHTTQGSVGSINIAGTGGSVIVDGALLANGRGAGQTGGQIAVNATGDVTIANGARIAANGRAGGGAIAVGTTLARATGGLSVTPTLTAHHTTVAQGATISANATTKGQGGTIAVLSTDLTTMQGAITAKGGPKGGDGGWVEISGGAIQLGGTVDVSAARGGTGTILLDPEDLTIAISGGPTLAPGGGDPSIAYYTSGTVAGDDFFVTPASLMALTGNVHLQASRSLVVASSFTITSGGVTLQAGNDLIVNAGVTISTPNGIGLQSGFNFGGTTTVNGYNSGATLLVLGSLTGNFITLNGAGGGVVLGAGTINSANSLSISTTGPIIESNLGVVNAQFTYLTGSSISLPGPNNVGTILDATASAGNILIANAPGNGIAAGPTITSEGEISVPTSGTITLIADGISLIDGFLSAPLGTIILAPASAGYGVEIIATGTASANTLSLNYNQLTNAISASTLELGTAQKLIGPINFGNTGDTIDLTNIQNGGGDGSTAPLNLGVYSTGAVTSNGTLLVGSLFGQANSVNINTSGGQIATIGSLTVTNDVTLLSYEPTTVAGPLTSTTGNVRLETSGSIFLTGNVTGSTVTLISADHDDGIDTSIIQNAGSITAAILSASAGAGTVSLTGANQVTALTQLVAGGSGAYLNNARSLIITDAVIDSSTTINVAGSIAVTGSVTSGATFSTLSLFATGAITQTGTGALIVSDLTAGGTSVSLPSATNAVDVILSGTASAGGFAFSDASTLTVGGTITASGANTIAITADTLAITNGAGTPGLGGALVVPGGTVSLAPLTAGRGYSVYGTAAVPTGISGFSVGNQQTLLSATVLQLGSPTTGAIQIGPDENPVTFINIGHLVLVSQSLVTQGAALSVPTLSGVANSVTLNAGNTISTLAGFTTTNGFTLNDTTQLTVSAPLSDGATLQLSDPAGIQINSNITANILTLGTAGTGSVIQNSGSIVATTLNATASQLSLTGGSNSIQNIGSVTTTTTFVLDDASNVTVTGTVNSSAVSLVIGGGLTVDSTITGGTATLAVSGTISEGTGGNIVETVLQGSATSANFTQPGNNVGTLAAFATTSGFDLTNGGPLTVIGLVTDPTSITISSLGSLVLAGSISAPSVFLSSTPRVINAVTFGPGDILQTAGAVSAASQLSIIASGSISQTGGSLTGGGTLTGSAGTTVSLTDAGNLIAALGSFSSAGGFALTDAQALSVTGPLADSGAGSTIALTTTTGSITLSGLVDGANVALVSAGTIDQTFGTLVATGVTGSGAGISLRQTANQISGLGSLTSTGSIYVADSTPLSLTGPISAGAGSTLTIIDDQPRIAGTLSAGTTGTIVLAPLTGGTGFALAAGIETPSVFEAVNPQPITAGLLVIGSVPAGPITVSGSIALPNVGTLDLISGGAVTGGGALSVSTLIGNAATIALTNANPGTVSSIGTLGAVTAPGGVTLVDGTGLTVTGPVNGNAGISLQTGGTLALAGTIVTTGTVQFLASSDITQPSGSISAATMFATSTAGAASFNAPTNAIGTLSTSSATSLSVVDSTSLVTGGVVSSSTGTISLAATGPLTINGEVLSAAGLTLVSTGAITETAQGYVQSGGPLQGSAGSLALNQANNAVSSIGSFTTTGGFTLDNETLTLAGPVRAGTTFSLDISGPLTLAGNVTAPTIAISVVNAGTVAASGNVTQTGGTLAASIALSLTADGTVSQTGGALVSATLSGSTGSTFSAQGTANLIGALGSFSSTGGFTLVDAQALTISGPATDTAGIALTTSAGGMTLTGVLNAPTIALNSAGTISQTGGSLVASLLGGHGAGVALGSSTNTVDTLGSFASTGNFTFADAVPLTVGGTISAGTGGTLTLANNVPSFSTTAALIAPGGTVVLAPLTAGDTLTLGGGGGVAGTSQVTANTLVIGSPTTGAITITGAFNLANVPTLDLISASSVTETGQGAVAVGALTGSSGGAFSLTGQNQVTTLGPIAAGGSIEVVDSVPVTLAGTISAPSQQILVHDDSITFGTGSLLSVGTTASAGVYLLPIGNGDTLVIGGGAGVTGAPVIASNLVLVGGGVFNKTADETLTAGSLQITGGLNFGAATVTLASRGAITETGMGALAASVLIVPQGTIVTLNGTNSIATLGSVATSGGFALADTPSLAVTGPVADDTAISLRSLGSLGLAGAVTAPTVTLNGLAGVAQTGGSLTATSLSVSGGLGVILGQATNSIGTLSAGTSGANLLIADATPLTIGGTVSVASGATLTLADDSFVFGSNSLLLAAGGTVALQPLTSGDPIALGGPASFAADAPVSANVLLIGSSTAGAITISGALNFSSVATLDLISAASITETAGAGLSVNALSASGASITLGGTNAIASLGSVATPGVLTLSDGTALSVAGPVTATGGVTLSAATLLNLAGSVTTSGTANLASTGAITQTSGSLTAATLTNSATSTSLNATTNVIGTLSTSTDTIAFVLVDNTGLIVTGVVDPASVSMTVNGPLTIAAPIIATNNVALFVTGAITEASGGGISAPLLQGSAASASFTQGNDAVTTLGSFTTASGFTLLDGTALSVTGPVTDRASIALRSLGTMTVAGNITAPSVSLTANSASAKTLAATDAVSVSTSVGRGDILQTGGTITGSTGVTLNADGLIAQSPTASIVAGTLSGGAGLTATLQATANLVATLGSFSSSGGFALTNGEALVVAGPLTDTASISVSTLAGLALNGVVDAPSVSLTASGAITQPGGSLIAGTLVLSGAGATLGQATNSIGALSAATISSASLLIADAATLTVGGTVSAPSGNITLVDDGIVFGSAALLNAPNGTVALQPLTAGDPITLGGPNAFAANPAVRAVALLIGSPTAGSITINGALNVTGAATLDLVSGATVSETGSGAIAVGTLIGSANGGFVLGGANQIAALGNMSSAAGVIDVSDTAPLTVAGTVSAPNEQISLFANTITFGTNALLTVGTSTAATTANGSLQGNQAEIFLVPYATGTPLVISGGFGTTGAPVTTASGVFIGRRRSLQTGSIIVASSLELDGQLNFGGASTVLTSSGAISQSGAFATGTLSVNSSQTTSGAVTLNGANLIGSLGTVNAGGGFSLVDATALTVTGPLTAPSIAVTAAGSLTLAGGSVIANAASFVVSSLVLSQTDAAVIGITEGGVTGQTIEPSTLVPTLFQTGTTQFSTLSGTSGQLLLQVPGGGLILLNNLQAPGFAVTLNTGTAGSSFGALAAGALSVIGSGGGADLSGTVGGKTGFDAAVVSRISPAFDPNYQINGCAIMSVTCTTQVALTLPDNIPPSLIFNDFTSTFLRPDLITLDLLTLAVAPDPDDPEEVLPNISRRDN